MFLSTPVFLNLAMKLIKWNLTLTLALVLIFLIPGFSQKLSPVTLSFTVTPDPVAHTYFVRMQGEGFHSDSIDFKMPAWTPGYYQLLNFASNISGFGIQDSQHKDLGWRKADKNTWRVGAKDIQQWTASYLVKASRAFVATSYVDAQRGYISPAGVFMNVGGRLDATATVTFQLPVTWSDIATGLEPVAHLTNKFTASDFDVLYDSPMLMGDLEELPPFEVKGIPHRFIGYQLGDFDRLSFMADLKKIVEASVNIFGDIPYKHYTFIAIGPGQGGIEHLNSTTFAFSGTGLSSGEGKRRMYAFLAHEYFHHYNVKRIRPIELGPFDYDKGSHTRMLWVSEGITVYYDMLLVRRAGLESQDDLLNSFRAIIQAHESKPGKNFQSATDASYNTWSDGPFGRTDEDENKTISVYDKGAILGLLLDLNIRQVSKNAKTLDDVMRALYKEFYLEKKRGFTETEFRAVCERIAGESLADVFEYTSSLKPIDYKKYFQYAGLDIDTTPQAVPGGWLGVATRMRKDSLVVTSVEFQSPAWKSGLRRQAVILKMDGAAPAVLRPVMNEKKAGEKVQLQILQGRAEKNFTIKLEAKSEPSFAIKPIINPNSLQSAILNSWWR